MRALLLAALLLAACGVAGAPRRPGTAVPVEPGIRITGEARAGLSGSF